jgi:hypothetical protein
VALTVLLAAYYVEMTPLRHLDSVFLFESSLSVLESGQPLSTTVASWPSAFSTLVTPAQEVCSSDLTMQGAREFNILDNHAYFAIYPIAIMTLVASPEVVYGVLNALSHVLLIAIPVLILWRRVGGLPAIAFGVWVAAYPPWSLSATGDYYLDRPYMALALMSLYMLDAMMRRDERLRDARWLATWALVTLGAALFTERATLMMMGAIGFFLVFFPGFRRSPRAVATLLSVGVILALYAAWYFSAVRVGITGGGDLLGNLDTNLLRTIQKPQAAAFLSVNLLLASVLVVLSGARYLALTICAMLPNLLISVGGAELNGWSTHYHTMYMPFVIFAASIGFSSLVGRARTRGWRIGVAMALGAFSIVVSGALDPYTGRASDRFGASFEAGITGAVWRYYTSPADPYKAMAEVAASLDREVPVGVRVSAPEAAMPSLYRDRSVAYYPVDLDDADYLVIQGIVAEGQVVSSSGATSYLGPDEQEALNACLIERAIAGGFELWKDIGPWLILRRAG